MSALLKATGNPGFRKLLEHEHGWLRPDHRGEDFLGERVTTRDGKVHLAPPILVEQAAKLEADFAKERASGKNGKLKLITKRAITTHNSWTHNIEDFAKRDGGTNYLYMHPDDAAARGLAEGDIADVRSDTAAVRIPIRLLADLMPGTVALPHGWGHQMSRTSVASKTTGVNVNILAADGPDRIEKVSGMAHLTGFDVVVDKASAPRDVSSWSGIAAS